MALKLNAEKINDLKARHGEVYKKTLRWLDRSGTAHQAEFVFRRPTVADLEMYGKQFQEAPMPANLNLVSQIIVEPEDKSPIVQELGQYPNVVTQFIKNDVDPFFGSGVAGETTEL